MKKLLLDITPEKFDICALMIGSFRKYPAEIHLRLVLCDHK
jgi:hypothetical protein